MARCSMLQFTAKQNFIRISERMKDRFTNRNPPSKLTPGQTWISSRQQQYPDRKETDLTKLQPFVITWQTHIKNARCPGKKISKEGKGVRLWTMMLIRDHYWHDLFSQNGRIKLHDNYYICYQRLNEKVVAQLVINLHALQPLRIN